VELLLQEGKEWLPSPDALRALRAVVVLEHLNTPESRRVLETLARGAPDDLGTRDAQAAVARLRHRPAASP